MDNFNIMMSKKRLRKKSKQASKKGLEGGRKKIEENKSERKKVEGKKNKVRKEIILHEFLHSDPGQSFSAEPGHLLLCLAYISCLL